MYELKVTYLGHACFSLEAKGYRIVIDPYQDGMIPGLPKLQVQAHGVYCSHGHGDHSYTQAVNICESKQDAPFTVQEFITPHDDQKGTLRGMNMVRIFDFSGLRVAHLGDLGDFPEADVLAALNGVDCLLIPVGGHYTIDAKTAKKIVDAVEPKVCVPMHYRTDSDGLAVISHLHEFTKQFPEVQECDNSFLLTGETPKQILVINYKY